LLKNHRLQKINTVVLPISCLQNKCEYKAKAYLFTVEEHVTKDS